MGKHGRVYGNLLRQILSRDERDQIFRGRTEAAAVRDATLSNFQALPFARPTLITFRVLKRNYLDPSPPAPVPRPPSGNEARWKNKRKTLYL